MKVKLLEETFSINYQTAEFVFKEDQRIFFELLEAVQAGATAGSEIISSGLVKTLVEIKGIESDDGKKIAPKDFFRLPREIVTDVRANFLLHIVKAGTPETEKNEQASN